MQAGDVEAEELVVELATSTMAAAGLEDGDAAEVAVQVRSLVVQIIAAEVEAWDEVAVAAAVSNSTISSTSRLAEAKEKERRRAKAKARAAIRRKGKAARRARTRRKAKERGKASKEVGTTEAIPTFVAAIQSAAAKMAERQN